MLSDAQILFPNSVIPSLRNLRGDAWAKLIDHVVTLPDDHPELLAFVLLIFRLNKCLDCDIDSFRAIRGCRFCALTVLKRFKGSDQDLLSRYQQAIAEIQDHLRSATPDIPAAA